MDRVGVERPVIIVGMHRSGTSLVTRLLKDLGLHIGNEVQGDYESIFYLNINDWILKKRGGSWDHPEKLLPLSDGLLKESVEYARSQIQSATFRHYFNTNQKQPIAWGWKDPRNSINFPVWDHLYPEAKYIHVYRNPVDVAESLRQRVRRSRDSQANWKRRWQKLLKWKEFIKKQPRAKHQGDANRLTDLRVGYSLWKTYTSHVLDWQGQLQADRFMSICYEEFLDSPEEILTKCQEFIGLRGIIDENMIGSINSSRRFAFRKNDELNEFYNEIKDEEVMSQMGYHQLQA